MLTALLHRFLETPTGYDFNAWLTIRGTKVAIQKVMPGLPGKRVLDVGCGPGTFSDLFIGSDYLGIDLNPAYIAAAIQRHTIQHPGAGHPQVVRDIAVASQRHTSQRFMVGDAIELQLAEQKFDLVLVNFFLHHLDDSEAVVLLSSLRACLAPGGCLLLHEPLLPEERRGVPRLLMRLDRGKHYRPLAQLRALVSETGLDSEIEWPYRQSLRGIPGSFMVVIRYRVRTAADIGAPS